MPSLNERTEAAFVRLTRGGNSQPRDNRTKRWTESPSVRGTKPTSPAAVHAGLKKSGAQMSDPKGGRSDVLGHSTDGGRGFSYKIGSKAVASTGVQATSEKRYGQKSGDVRVKSHEGPDNGNWHAAGANRAKAEGNRATAQTGLKAQGFTTKGAGRDLLVTGKAPKNPLANRIQSKVDAARAGKVVDKRSPRQAPLKPGQKYTPKSGDARTIMDKKARGVFVNKQQRRRPTNIRKPGTGSLKGVDY